MKLEELQKYFDEAESHKICLKGICHSCMLPVSINIDLEEDGRIVVTGGAIYHPQTGTTKKDSSFFMKCDKCYKEDHTLKNYQPCAVYSRVVGFLRPVSDWNDGKKAEWRQRKVFKNE